MVNCINNFSGTINGFNNIIWNSQTYVLVLPRPPRAKFTKDAASRLQCNSPMHVHAAIPLTTSVLDKNQYGTLFLNYLRVEYFWLSLEAAGNIMLVSMPSVLDLTACPLEYGLQIHASQLRSY